MEDTCFEQLWLRLGPGAANLYCHQGGCEHLLTFQVWGGGACEGRAGLPEQARQLCNGVE
jgi:hypothetical protein